MSDIISLFEKISAIPRESGNEKAISDWIRDWSRERGFDVTQDDIWNLIIRKPASAGYENHPPVLMQAHIDMVCEKDAESTHNFATDPITFKREGDWIMSATGTTLGADNGVGVAAALAVLDDGQLPHPPLEVVFTVQEETTFDGAATVDVSSLKARRLINLDHADERELIVGSCGGTGVIFTMPLERGTAETEAGRDTLPGGIYRIRLSGLKGGHSGEDIHRGRGNAISMLLRALEAPELKLISMHGGTNRLAIPREAEAVVLAPDRELLQQIIAKAEQTFRREYAVAAPELTITMEEAGEPETPVPLTDAAFRKLSAVLRLYPNGIMQMNGGFNGLVESSDNIGIVTVDEDGLTLTSEVRGAYQSTVEDIRKTIEALASMTGAEVEYFAGYTPWEFKAESPLRSLAANTYEEMFGGTMRQLALHAGLECGFFAEKIPGLDIISIGPDCQYFHSPQERVSVKSIGHFYEYLKALLQKL